MKKIHLQVYNQHADLIYTKELEDRNALPKLVKKKDCPVSFCCLQGFCGACLVEVVSGQEALEPPSDDEIMALDEFSPFPERHRLFCQTKLKTNIEATIKVKIRT